MITNLDSRNECKCFRWFSVLIERYVFCFTLLWYYKERYDSGIGLFRISIGKLIEYKDRYGIVIECLGFSWKKLRKTK